MLTFLVRHVKYAENRSTLPHQKLSIYVADELEVYTNFSTVGLSARDAHVNEDYWRYMLRSQKGRLSKSDDAGLDVLPL